MKLVKVDKAYSEIHRKSKPVPVRPGLALGVITLQVILPTNIDYQYILPIYITNIYYQPIQITNHHVFVQPSAYVGSRYGTMIVFNIIERLELDEVFLLSKILPCPMSNVHSDLNFQKKPPQVFLSWYTTVQTICHTKYPLEAQRVLSPADTKHILLRN